jgi:uncharacterized protein (DUF362 family)
MSEKISRRSFFKKTAAIGVGSMVVGNIVPNVAMADPKEKPDISVVKGKNYFDITVKAVEELGGMGKFVHKGSKVAILANPQRNNPGAFTKPAVLEATIQMCKKAGAKEINCISWLPEKNWESTGLKKVVDDEGANLLITDRKDESLFKPVPIPKGKSLKEARIMKTFFDSDIFIDMPVTKDHAGNKFTGTLKNLMGLSSPVTNRTFHKPNWTTDSNAIRHLDQCIADLNTIIKPHLCIVDATEFIITNGPFGPGKLHKPQKVVAGTDRVAIDAYCCTLWGLDAKNIIMINEAYNHQLGEIDLKKVKIKETKI